MVIAQRLNAARSLISNNFFISVILLIALYGLSARFFFTIELTESMFTESVILVEVLSKRTFLLMLAVTVVLLLLNFVPHSRNRYYGIFSWEALKTESGIQLRWVIFAISVVIAWTYSTYEYNFFFDQAHYLDRILVIATCIGILFSPIFTGFFVLLVIVVAEQFIFPLEHYTWTDKKPLYEFMLLFFYFVALRLVIRLKVNTFVFAGLCLVASYYAMPGLTKLTIGRDLTYWILNNDLHIIPVSRRMNDWLTFISLPDVINMANTMKWFDVPMQLYTVLAEAGCFLFLLHKRLTLVLLVMVVILHTAIFITSGILFWKWAMLDAILFVFLWRNRNQVWLNNLYKPRLFIFSLVVIAAADLYFTPFHLGWFDSRANNTIGFEAVTEDGQVYNLSRNFFAPYDVVFVQNRFGYLVDEPLLSNISTQGELAIFEALRDLESPDGFPELKQRLGLNSYNPERVEIFINFIREFIQNHNERLDDVFIPSIFPAPHHIFSSVDNAYADQAPIETVRIRFVESYFNGSEMFVLQDRILYEIEIPEEDA